MSVSSTPRLTEPQKEVLNTLPEPSGRNKRAYKALVEKGLVLKISDKPLRYERKELGDQVLAQLREENLVAPVEETDEPTVIQEPEEAVAPVELVEPNLTEVEVHHGPTLALVPPEAVPMPSVPEPVVPDEPKAPEAEAPESSDDAEQHGDTAQPEIQVSACKWCHEEKPLTKEHWYRKSETKGGGFYIEGRCKPCEKAYRTDRAAKKASGEVTPRTRHANRPAEAEAYRELTVVEGYGGHPEYVLS